MKDRTSDTSASAQRLRLLAYLRRHGSVNTFEARQILDIMMPAARVKELRAQGHNIETHLGTLCDDQGREQPNVATYYLSADPAGKVAA